MWLAAWLSSHCPQKKSALGYTEIAYFSLPCFPSSPTNQFTQKLIASTTGGLLWLATTYTSVSWHASGHSWTKAQRHLCMITVLRIMRQRMCNATTGKHAEILLDVTGRAHPGQEKPLLIQAGPDSIAELGRNAWHFDCLKLFLSGLCSWDGLLKMWFPSIVPGIQVWVILKSLFSKNVTECLFFFFFK